MEKIARIIEKCISALRKAPAETSSKLTRLFRELSEFLEGHPDYVSRTLPILLKLYRSILEGNYAEAFEQLCLLVVLIRLRNKR